MTRQMLPLLVFILLVTVLAAALWRGKAQVSPLAGRPAPAVSVEGLSARDLAGAVVVNFFASWCVPCAAEQPVLLELKRRGARITGIAYRDDKEKTAAFLARHGDPFAARGHDPQGAAAVAFGLRGVPETFVIGADGVIRLHHAGPLAPQDLPRIEGALR